MSELAKVLKIREAANKIKRIAIIQTKDQDRETLSGDDVYKTVQGKT